MAIGVVLDPTASLDNDITTPGPHAGLLSGKNVGFRLDEIWRAWDWIADIWAEEFRRAGATVKFWRSDQGRTGAEGERNSPLNPNRPLPDRPAAALIGRIGDRNQIFFIGADSGPFRARDTGRLYLGINDDVLTDNSGNLRVPVSYYPPARTGDDRDRGICHDRDMLNEFSNQLADAVERVAASVVQVQGRRRPASGVVYADGIVLTTMRAIGGDDGLRVKRHDGTVLEAELAGWDPATSLAVLRVANLGVAPLTPSSSSPRVGNLALAVARSWSNALTASAGIVSVIGGPLVTARRRAIDHVIRTTAPMHDGFSGGAFIDAAGGLLGINTATTIRGTTVVIPAGIAWAAAQRVLEQGQSRRGYLGVLGQPVTLSAAQASTCGRETAVLVVGVAPSSALTSHSA